jgi:hypothetical protein
LDCTSNQRLPSPTAQSDLVSTHFHLISASRPNRVTHTSKLLHNLLLSLGELDVTAGMSSAIQECLLQNLLLEHDRQLLLTDLKHGRVSERRALCLVINDVPCTLHLETRARLKLFARLLHIVGLDCARLGSLPGCDTSSSQKRQTEVVHWSSGGFGKQPDCGFAQPTDQLEVSIQPRTRYYQGVDPHVGVFLTRSCDNFLN